MNKKRNKKYAKGEDYLQSNPQYRKWINECIGCRAKGYKPEMPPHHVRGYFDSLSLDELGMCEPCARAAKRTR